MQLAIRASAFLATAFATTTAFAHGPAGSHTHPHGVITNEPLVGLAACAVLAVGVAIAMRRKTVRQRRTKR
ncbi:MAG: hypothetical protein AAFV26_03635 [Pseudomonadota bacterium]